MNNQIKVGDIVQVVRESFCIGGNDGLGHTFTVVKILTESTTGPCDYCNRQSCGSGLYAGDGKAAWPFNRLKRIPPLEEMDDVATGDLAEQRRLHDAWAKA